MIHELPLGTVTINTANLLYNQVCEKFIELLKENPERLLTVLNENQTNAESLTSLRNELDNLKQENAKLEDEMSEMQEEIDKEEDIDLGLDHIFFSFEKGNINVREKFDEFVRSCQPILSQQKSIF